MFAKIVLGVVIGASLLCVGVLGAAYLFFRSAVTTNPASAQQAAGQIVDSFTLPAGYSQQYSARALGFTVWAANSASGKGHVFLAQVPEGLGIDPAAIQSQVQNVAQPQGSGRPERLQTIGHLDAVVRGQAVSLLLQEGTSGSGYTYRELTGLFEGKNGTVMVNVSAPLAEWDQAAFLQFVESIR